MSTSTESDLQEYSKLLNDIRSSLDQAQLLLATAEPVPEEAMETWSSIHEQAITYLNTAVFQIFGLSSILTDRFSLHMLVRFRTYRKCFDQLYNEARTKQNQEPVRENRLFTASNFKRGV